MIIIFFSPFKYITIMSNFKIFRVVYNFNHSKMGFQNSVSVEALNEVQAIENAKREVSMCYGSKMLTRFSFAAPVIIKHL